MTSGWGGSSPDPPHLLELMKGVTALSILGADVNALRGFADGLRGRAHQLDELVSRLTPMIDGLPWSGPDRDRFVRAWHGDHAAALTHVCSDMRDAATLASTKADEQLEASRAQGGQPGPGGGGW